MQKQLLTQSRWLVTIMLLTALSSGNVWGATETLPFFVASFAHFFLFDNQLVTFFPNMP